MDKSRLDVIKQYIMLVIAITVVLIVYLILNHVNMYHFISYDKDKPIDEFIYNLIQNDGTNIESFFSFCEYNLQNMLIYILKMITQNNVFAINLYYLLSFYLIAFAMFWCMHQQQVSKEIAIYVSVLTAFIPYHIDRGEGQIITSSFFLVPFFIGFIYENIFICNDRFNVGYIIFMLASPFVDIRLSVMMLIMIPILAINCGNSGMARKLSFYFVMMLFSSIVVSLLTGIFKVNDLKESIGLAREEGLRLCDMLMPLRYHFVRRLSDFRVDYDITFQASGESGLNSMGVLLSFFFIFGLFSVFFVRNIDKRILWLSWMNVIVVLIANTRGFNLIFEYLGIHIVYWNRMAVLILVNSAIIMGITVDKLLSAIQSGTKQRLIKLIYVAVGGMGLLELLLRQNMGIF